MEKLSPDIKRDRQEQKKFSYLLYFSKYFQGKIKLDDYLLIGVLFVIASTMLFFFNMDKVDGGSGIFSVLFLIHYGIAIFYWIILGAYFRKKALRPFSTRMLRGHTLLLILFNISAFSLNREMALFDKSADWLSYLIDLENN